MTTGQFIAMQLFWRLVELSTGVKITTFMVITKDDE